MTPEPSDSAELSFVDRPLPPGFELRVVIMAAWSRRAYDEAEWNDALVVVEFGTIELEWLSGARSRFRRGDVLWLGAIELRALQNPGAEPAVLAAVSRQPAHP